MKILIIIILFLGSMGITFKVTFDMTQEIVGALWIEGIIIDHKVHSKLVKELKAGDHEAAMKIAEGMESYNEDLLQTLVTSLEDGNYQYFSKEEIIKGREYLTQLSNKNGSSK